MQQRQAPGRGHELSSLRRSRVRRTGGARQFRRPGSGGGGLGALLVFGVLIVLVGGLYVVSQNLLGSSNGSAVSVSTAVTTSRNSSNAAATAGGRPVSFVVKSGATWTDVANELQQAGLIPSATLFRIQVRLTGSTGNLKPGAYTLKPGMSNNQIIAALEQSTPPQQTSVTFIEGWRMEQDAAALEKAGVTTASNFLSVTKNQSVTFNNSFLADRPAGATLEGYLFPDTYDFLKNTAASDVVAKMLNRFGQVVTPQMRAQAKAQGHTLYQVIIVASIVEREAKAPSERPLIAGVYWNRLKQGQCMCADPTVQYALGSSSNWWPPLNAEARTLAPDSPFNTYNHLGFPPGPIADPGLASIQAALNPQGDYLYFVAKGDGTHVFSHTLQEQNQNIQKIQQSASAQ